MNTYSLGISVSWFIAIASIIIAVAISFFYYRKTVPVLSPKNRIILFLLRASAISLLLFIIFEPILTSIRGSIKKPILAILLDNSISMGIQDGKYQRKDIYRNILNELDLTNSNLKYHAVSFDRGFNLMNSVEFDSLGLTGQETNISKAFDWIKKDLKTENIGSVLLISDGAFNAGSNPIYKSEELGKPVYVIGVGDTAEAKDISVISLFTNQIVHLRSKVPVNVNINVSGFSGSKVEVRLFDNGRELSSKIISIDNDSKNYSIYFEYYSEKEGIHKLSASVIPQAGELTDKNNSVSEFIEVTTNKKKIVVLAGAPSPDLSFILNSLKTDEGNDIQAFIQKKKSKYYKKSPEINDLRNADIILLLGYPNKYTPNSDIKKLKTVLQDKKSLLFLASKDVDYTKLKIIAGYLPFSIIAANNKEYSTVADFTGVAENHPLFRTNSEDNILDRWNELPPLYRTEIFVKPKPKSIILAKVKVSNVVLNEPMIIVNTLGEQKSLAILAYNIYRWKLLGYAQDKYRNPGGAIDLFDSFVNNSVQWLTTETNKKNVIIKPVKNNFISNERIDFYAQVYDGAMNPVDNANTSVRISDGRNVSEITLEPLGNGRYTGYIEMSAAGEYFYSGKANQNGKTLGIDKGRFVIGDISKEYLNLRQNKRLLAEIANRSGGNFYFNDNIDNLLSDIETNPKFREKAITLKDEFGLWNLPVILVVVIFLFAFEWFLRKRLGLL